MALETCVSLKMIHVLLVIKMMEDKHKLVFYLPHHVLLDLKIMVLEICVFLKLILVHQDTKMMED